MGVGREWQPEASPAFRIHPQARHDLNVAKRAVRPRIDREAAPRAVRRRRDPPPPSMTPSTSPARADARLAAREHHHILIP